MKNILVAVALISSSACAFAGDIWAVANVRSYHVSEQQFNQHNPGLGLEYHLDDSVVLMAGKYRNSVYRNSAYALAGWTPLHVSNIYAGLAAGAVNGYPALNSGKVAPVIVGLVRIEAEHVGANLIVIPKYKESPLTFGLQLKFKF